jgi:hypothetical protein
VPFLDARRADGERSSKGGIGFELKYLGITAK